MTTFAGQDVLSSADQTNDYGKWLIHGPQGAGKSTLASTIAQCGRTLYIDLIGEKGTRAFQGAPWAKNIDVIRPDSITALDDVFWSLAKGGHPYKAVVLDSQTAAQKMTMRYLLGHDETAVKEITKGSATAEFKTWGQSLDIMTDISTFWYGLADGERDHPMHVVMTAQTKKHEDDDTGEAFRAPDVQRGALSIVLAVPDYVVYCYVEEPDFDDEGTEPQHLVKFGAHPAYRCKARIPYSLRGKIPNVLGRKSPTNLTSLSRVLGVGGVPKKASASNTNPTEKKEA